MIDLITLFDSLQPPSVSGVEEARFSAYPIPNYEQHRLGKNAKGEPAILISVTETSYPKGSSPVVLEHLTVQHNVDCLISHAHGTLEKGKFTVLRCAGADRVLQVYFLRVASALIVSLGSTPSQSDVTKAIERLVELFRAMSQPPRKSVQGLWAELFLIVYVRNSRVMVKAWHAMPEDRYDFSEGEQRIEVKSTASRVRQHHFSLEQLNPPSGTSVLVASLFVERSGAGVSAMDLADEARLRLSGDIDLLLHLDRVISLTLGNSWRYALEDRFDRSLAEQSLAFFETKVIPSVCPDLPIGVSDVHFKSDLTGKPTIDLQKYKAKGGLFLAALCEYREYATNSNRTM